MIMVVKLCFPVSAWSDGFYGNFKFWLWMKSVALAVHFYIFLIVQLCMELFRPHVWNWLPESSCSYSLKKKKIVQLCMQSFRPHVWSWLPESSCSYSPFLIVLLFSYACSRSGHMKLSTRRLLFLQSFLNSFTVQLCMQSFRPHVWNWLPEGSCSTRASSAAHPHQGEQKQRALRSVLYGARVTALPCQCNWTWTFRVFTLYSVVRL